MKLALFALCALCCSTTALADSWEFPNEVIRKEHTFGETRIVLEIDGTKDQAFPPHTLSIYDGEELVAKYKNIGFDKVFPSKDNKFFVGVSNVSIPGTAFVVFDAEGNLLRDVKHRFLPPAMHTLQTSGVLQMWYDGKNPNVEFDVRNGRLGQVHIRGSNEQTYSLLSPDFGFRDSK